MNTPSGKWNCVASIQNLLLIILIFPVLSLYAQAPANDNCANAQIINIASAGFGTGTFASTQADLTAATVQPGETFAPSIIVSGINKKSAWFKFSIPTPRSVRVSLGQPGNGIQAGNAGFTIYKASTCVPANIDISSKLSPIETFGSTFHPCVEPGDYLVQVSGNTAANGPITITVELDPASPSPYDEPVTAQQFGNVTPNKITGIDYYVECQSIKDATEICLPNGSFKDFTKSTWHTFITPASFDYISVLLGSPIFASDRDPDYTIGYRLYEGNGVNTPIASLTQIGGCDSMVTNGYYPDRKVYKCGQLKPGTTYTIQLLYHKNFKRTMRLAIGWNGIAPTKGHEPVTGMPTPNNIGVLPANSTGLLTKISDNLACNSRHDQHSCPKSMPVNGVLHKGYRYNLSTFFSFKLSTSTTLTYTTNGTCSSSPSYLLRLYKQGVTANCADLDTANIISVSEYGTTLSCLDAGNYVLQILGADSTIAKGAFLYSYLQTSPYPICLQRNLGSTIDVSFTAKTEVVTNKFSLGAAGIVGKMNTNAAGVMQPLIPYRPYVTDRDTFGCAHTVTPDDNNLCADRAKSSYTEFVLADSAILYSPSFNGFGKLYKGDAHALAISQNAHAFGQKLTGLQPYSMCYYNYSGSTNACVIPGTYSIVSFGSHPGREAYVSFNVRTPKTKHASPATAQNMGDLWSYMAPNTPYQTDIDTFTCKDNPETIGGLAPCAGNYGPSNKLIYRQFYLRQPTLVSISYVGYIYPIGNRAGAGKFTLFSGKASDGLAGLLPVGSKWTCFTTGASTDQCDALPAGWYTVVSYGSGPNYSDPLANLPSTSQYSQVGEENFFFISLGKACDAPAFNRPSKASVDTITKQPYKIEWGPQTGHTAAYPVTSKKYTLNRENFDCSQDTAFIRQHITRCNADNVKVAFYIFQTTQESYVQIDNIPEGIWASVYAFDARTSDSVRLKTEAPFQPCLNRKGSLEFCKLQPGIYTLIVFAPASYTCHQITPSIYIDQVGYSRFDHASNAYDFGDVKPDSIWYNGKPGDINPLNSSRAPSNDFFYCTTGAREKDPTYAQCLSIYNPNIYNPGNNIVLHPDNATAPDQYNIDRRNLWYTFTISQPGWVKIKVQNKTPGKNIPYFAQTLHQYPYAVYKRRKVLFM
jgi:hypothetical protein